MMDLEGEVVNIFKGNEATVGSLSQSLETEIVSGKSIYTKSEPTEKLIIKATILKLKYS